MQKPSGVIGRGGGDSRHLHAFRDHPPERGQVLLAGKPVTSVADLRKALVDAKSQGKHDVLMRVKGADATLEWEVGGVDIAVGQAPITIESDSSDVVNIFNLALTAGFRVAFLVGCQLSNAPFIYTSAALLQHNLLRRLLRLPGAAALPHSSGEALSRFRDDVEETSVFLIPFNDLIAWAIREYFPRADNLLEVGCGTGFVLAGLMRRFPNIEPFGGSISQPMRLSPSIKASRRAW